MTKAKGYRHGDLALIVVGSLPSGLKESKSKVLMTGSGGNDHTFTDGKFYPENVDGFIIGYLVAGKNCKLYHPDHGCSNSKNKTKTCSIPAGVYQLIKQVEDTHEGMRQVVD